MGLDVGQGHILLDTGQVPTKLGVCAHISNIDFMGKAKTAEDMLLMSFIFSLSPLGWHTLRMPVLSPASQAGPRLRNPREGTSVVLHDTIRLT